MGHTNTAYRFVQGPVLQVCSIITMNWAIQKGNEKSQWITLKSCSAGILGANYKTLFECSMCIHIYFKVSLIAVTGNGDNSPGYH